MVVILVYGQYARVCIYIYNSLYRIYNSLYRKDFELYKYLNYYYKDFIQR